MTAQTILPANSVVDSGYDVANSCRFDDGSSAYMHKTPGGAGNRQKFTFSCWVKKTSGGTEELLSVGGSDYTRIGFEAGDEIKIFGVASGSTAWEIQTVAKFRDFSAWYNFVFAFDTTQGTASNRIKIYVNGVRVAPSSGFGDETYPDQNYSTNINNAEKHRVGIANNDSSAPFDGYMSEVVLIDGQQLAPTEFGEFDEDSGIWKPIDVSGLTAGTNGFYLDFEDSANLGNDAFGGTDLTEVNLAATDQSTDTCTNNFCVINSLDNFYAGSTLSEGNLKVLTISGNAAYNPATFGLIKGKWYWEVKLVTCSAGDNSEATIIGISNQSPVNAGYTGSIVVNDGIGIRGDGNAWGADGSAGGGASTSGWDAIAVGNTAMIAVDFDNGKLYHGINGTWGNSGDPTSGSTGTGAYSFTVGSDAWFPGVNQRETSQTGTFELNFGSPSYAISSGNTDGDGYGNFEYAVPSGYYSLNTKNLAEYG